MATREQAEITGRLYGPQALYDQLSHEQQKQVNDHVEVRARAEKAGQASLPPDERQPAADDAVTDLSHPFADHTRRADITLYPPIPGAILNMPRARIVSLDEVGKGIEFLDEKGNYYRAANMPYMVVSYDPNFDADTEGRIIRTAGKVSIA